MDFLYELRRSLGMTSPEQDADHFSRQALAGEAMLRGAPVQPSVIAGMKDVAGKPLDAAFDNAEAGSRRLAESDARARATAGAAQQDLDDRYGDALDDLRRRLQGAPVQPAVPGVNGSPVKNDTDVEEHRKYSPGIGLRG